MARQTEKRDRLLHTAITLVYQQGFHQTTLADIAQQAQVPLGTVYSFLDKGGPRSKPALC